MSNVCRHRGTLLQDTGLANATKIVCPYHAWTYNHSGELLGAPYAHEDEISNPEHCLPHFHLEIWNGLIFVNLSHTPPFINQTVRYQ